MKPTISIITAVRNAASTIAGCIESIQAQTVPVEHIIIDGGSTDCTLEVIERYRCGIAQVVSEPDRGIYDAMNKGIALATGEIIGILNSDDFFAHPGVLAKVAETMADESIDSCYGDLDYVKFAGDWETRNQEPGTRNQEPASPFTLKSHPLLALRSVRTGQVLLGVDAPPSDIFRPAASLRAVWLLQP